MDRVGEAAVTGYLRRLAREPQDRALPLPGDLYRRARLLDRLFGEPAPVRQAMRRLALADVLGVLVASSALVLSLAWAGAAVAERVLSWPLPWLAPEQVVMAVLAVVALGAAASFASLWPLLAGAEE